MTNADRIRCMETDEIIEFLLQQNKCPPDDFVSCQEWDCDRVECWKKWLKKEAKDDA